MGKGGDAGLNIRSGSGRLLRRSDSVVDKLNSMTPKFEAKERMRRLHSDLTVLKNIWFKRLPATDDHAARMESFYKDQAHACEFPSS